jgi:acetyltransferase-like isoleucine patch superfamily enzyme
MNKLKAYIIRFLALFGIKFSIYFLAILPFCYAVTRANKNLWDILLMAGSILLCPLLIILLVGLCSFILPKAEVGKSKLFSPQFTKWFTRDTVADIVASSSLLSNLVVRTDFIKIVYFRLLGMKNPSNVIFAPGIHLFDADKLFFGENVFMGFRSLISGHFIKNGILELKYSFIEKNVVIGAYSKIGPGVRIGEGSTIGFGVEIGSNCHIGKNVQISDGVVLDDYATVEDNSIVGKKCILGRRSAVGRNSFIGSYSSLGAHVHIKPYEKIEELSTLKPESKKKLSHVNP